MGGRRSRNRCAGAKSAELVRREIGRIPPAWRHALVLREVDQLPMPEVAEQLGISLVRREVTAAAGAAGIAAAIGKVLRGDGCGSADGMSFGTMRFTCGAIV